MRGKDSGPVPVPTRRFDAWMIAAMILATAVMLFSLYRAATQSITHDEAVTYTRYISRPVADMFVYDANNHILHTWMVRASVACFGGSVLAIRIPALIGTTLYLAALLGVVHMTIPRGRWVLLAVASASLNPLLLDFFACARGYSLALACLMAAVLCLFRCLRTPSRNVAFWLTCVLGGVCLGLAVTANLPFLPVAASGGLMFVLMSSRDDGSGEDSRFLLTTGCVALSALAVVVCTLLPCMSTMEPGRFVLGYKTWQESASDLLNASFLARETAVTIPTDTPAQVIPEIVLAISSRAGAAFMIIVTVALIVHFLRVGLKGMSPPARAALLFSGSTVLAVVFYATIHFAFQVKYPADRAVIYLVPLVSLGTICALLAWSGRPRWAEWTMLVLVLALVARYVTELHPTYFRTWFYDADSREVFHKMKETLQSRPDTPILIGGDWYFLPAINFYRMIHDAWDLPPRTATPYPKQFFHFFIVGPGHDEDLSALAFVPMLTGKTSGVTLYANPTALRHRKSGG